LNIKIERELEKYYGETDLQKAAKGAQELPQEEQGKS
jgi:hypothetical protein